MARRWRGSEPRKLAVHLLSLTPARSTHTSPWGGGWSSSFPTERGLPPTPHPHPSLLSPGPVLGGPPGQALSSCFINSVRVMFAPSFIQQLLIVGKTRIFRKGKRETLPIVPPFRDSQDDHSATFGTFLVHSLLIVFLMDKN